MRPRANRRGGGPPASAGMSFAVDIDEIVIEGFDTTDRRAIDDAVRERLAQLLATGERSVWPGADVDHDRIRTADAVLERSAAPPAIGAAIANAVRDGIGRDEGVTPE
jgi:hypothetical protein